MKKISLLLFATFAVLATAGAQNVQWPESYSTSVLGGTWWGEAAAEDLDYATKTAQIARVADFYDLAFPREGEALTFDQLWAEIPDATVQSIDRSREGKTAVPGNADKGTWKATYDDDNIFLLVKYADDAAISGGKFEVMYSPYYKLEGYVTTAMDPSAATGVPYVRFGAMGGWKVEVNAAGATDSHTTIMANPMEHSGTNENEYNTLTGNTVNDFKVLVQIPFASLYDQENNVEFSIDNWATINDGKGIAWDVKYVRNGDEEYCWSTDFNDTYYSNVRAGYLNINEYISVEGVVADEDSNMTITNNQITLANAVNVQIYNVSGLLVMSVSGLTEIPTTELASGVYIVVAGNETAKFVK